MVFKAGVAWGGVGVRGEWRKMAFISHRKILHPLPASLQPWELSSEGLGQSILHGNLDRTLDTHVINVSA